MTPTEINKTEYFDDFQKVAGLLLQIRSCITEESDTVWAGFENVKAFFVELNKDIENIQACDFQTLKKIQIEFLPSSTYQELSLSNGWSEMYLQLATEFDAIYERLSEQKKILTNNSSNSKPSLWHKIFGK